MILEHGAIFSTFLTRSSLSHLFHQNSTVLLFCLLGKQQMLIPNDFFLFKNRKKNFFIGFLVWEKILERVVNVLFVICIWNCEIFCGYLVYCLVVFGKGKLQWYFSAFENRKVGCKRVIFRRNYLLKKCTMEVFTFQML